MISREGHERFIRAPLIETTPRFFPDAWQPDLDGVRALALRLLAYAGLEELDVDVEPFVNEEDVLWPELVQGESHSRQKHGTAEWFRGIEEGCCLLGVDLALVTDPERLVGVLAHEVAQAWRFRQGLMAEDSELEEEGVTVCPYWRKVRAEGKDIPDELDDELDDENPEELPKRGAAS